jgi:hypothetical protein
LRKDLCRGLILRVERREAGMEIPFDKMYFFKKEDEPLFPRVFKNAMVLPINTELAKQITKVVSADKRLSFKAYPFTRSGEQTLLNTMSRQRPLEDIIDKRKEYRALVPVLFTKYGTKLLKGKRRKGRRKHSVFPAYLIARPDREATVGMLRRALSVRAYFILDGKAVKPICLMCPRHQYWLQGDCHMGEKICYTHLAQAKQGDLVLGVKRYEEYAAMIDEPELKGI